MSRVTLVILAVVTVLAWSAATHLLPQTWWGALVTMAVGVVFAFPLREALGLTTKAYLRFGAGLIVLVPVLHAAMRDAPRVHTWVAIALVLVAAVGLAIARFRRRPQA